MYGKGAEGGKQQQGEKALLVFAGASVRDSMLRLRGN